MEEELEKLKTFLLSRYKRNNDCADLEWSKRRLYGEAYDYCCQTESNITCRQMKEIIDSILKENGKHDN